MHRKTGIPKRGLWRAPLLALCAMLPCTAQAATAAPPSPKTTFFHANALYRDGHYAAAAREYEELRRAGWISGNLYFNLGNAYFKAGDKGQAILNYERARRLLPRDPDVTANLAYARSLTGAAACRPALWRRAAFPLARRVTTSGLAWTSSILYTLLVFGLVAHRLWPRRPRWLLYAAVTMGVLAVVAGASLADRVIGDDWRRQAVVVQQGDTPARFEPADNGTVHFTLKEGARVTVLDRRPGWRQIARCDGRRGWVEAKSVAPL
jgi:Tetratricopeptide repeat/Bacterial SH3 domain